MPNDEWRMTNLCCGGHAPAYSLYQNECSVVKYLNHQNRAWVKSELTIRWLPQERAWLDKFVAHGYVDTFRHFNKGPDQYSWWDLKTRARERNVGWRIDYFFVTGDLIPALSDAFIMPEVTGSDHCPVGIMLKI